MRPTRWANPKRKIRQTAVSQKHQGPLRRSPKPFSLMVAGARNHRNRLDSPSRRMLSDCLAASPLGSSDVIEWELRGNGCGNLPGE